MPSVKCVATLSSHANSQVIRGAGGEQGRIETLGRGGNGLACSCIGPSYRFASCHPFLPSTRLSPRPSTRIRALEEQNAFPFTAGSMRFSRRNSLVATAPSQEKILQLMKTRNPCEVTSQHSAIRRVHRMSRCHEGQTFKENTDTRSGCASQFHVFFSCSSSRWSTP